MGGEDGSDTIENYVDTGGTTAFMIGKVSGGKRLGGGL